MLAHLIALLTTLPIISFCLFFILCYLYLKNKKEALQWAMIGCTFFLILSIGKTIEQLWSLSFTWLLFILVLIIAICLTYLQYTIRGQVNYNKLFKGTFTISFLFFLPIHVLLYLWVIVSSFTYSLFS